MPTAIKIHADLPLVWHPQAGPAGTDGVLLLRVLALLEAAPPHYDEEDSAELQRWQAMEARVDLCLHLLGQLLLRDGPLPQVCPVSLSGDSASWCSEQELPIGQQGTLALYLSPRIPQPLLLPAQITAAEQLPAGGWQLEAQFRLGDDELQDWLDKTIFRRHRREIFERKHAHEE